MPAGLQVDAAPVGGPSGRAGSTPAQSNLVAEIHPANTLFRPWFDLRVKMMKLQKDISRFEAAWQAANGKLDPFALALFERRRKLFNATQIAQLDPSFRRRTRFSVVRQATGLRRWCGQPLHVDWDARFVKNPALALLAVHAADGHLRERAVRVMPVDDTAALTTLLLRCNDWVMPVRKAAFMRLEAVLPKLHQSALIPLCLFALDRVTRWERGGAKTAELLAAHPDWPVAVKTAFMETATGPMARLLRQLLRNPDYDWALPDLALRAQSVFVRAVAVEVLLTGYARWTAGYDWVWHDKVFNLRHKVPRREKRAVEVSSATRAMVLRYASQAKSAKLRSLAADYLITVGPAQGDNLVDLLTTDKAKSVQWRMAFYHKKWGGNPSAKES